MHLKNASTKFAKELWYWQWYKYAHDYKNAKIDQQHLPDNLKWRIYFDE
jgi:putative ATPase